MAHHPRGIAVEIVGTESGTNGRTCEQHTVACGHVLDVDMVVRLDLIHAMTDTDNERSVNIERSYVHCGKVLFHGTNSYYERIL